jgi:hypothetical protein
MGFDVERPSDPATDSRFARESAVAPCSSSLSSSHWWEARVYFLAFSPEGPEPALYREVDQWSDGSRARHSRFAREVTVALMLVGLDRGADRPIAAALLFVAFTAVGLALVVRPVGLAEAVIDAFFGEPSPEPVELSEGRAAGERPRQSALARPSGVGRPWPGSGAHCWNDRLNVDISRLHRACLIRRGCRPGRDRGAANGPRQPATLRGRSRLQSSGPGKAGGAPRGVRRQRCRSRRTDSGP